MCTEILSKYEVIYIICKSTYYYIFYIMDVLKQETEQIICIQWKVVPKISRCH